MLLWIAFALLTAAVLAWLLAPLAQAMPAGEVQAAAETGAEAGARAVYRDQLAEIDAERAAGLIGDAEAEAARNEVSRRLLASAARAEAAQPPAPAAAARVGHRHVALATALGVPVLTLAIYLTYGAPGLSSAGTEAEREMVQLARMIGKVEARLKAAPEDGRGWAVIAPVYLKLGRFADAATAYANAARLQGESIELLSGLAESLIMAKGGVVTEEAREASEKILRLAPGSAEPRYWLARGKEQDGRLADALADYTSLLKEAPAGATYRPLLEKHIAEVTARINAGPGAKAAKAPSGPAAADIEAIAKLPAADRAAMITGMVDGLAERLKRDGKDLAGWKRLIQSYKVLGRHDDARSALTEARRQLAGDAAALADLSQLAAKLGLGS